jgi:hypothetical protein
MIQRAYNGGGQVGYPPVTRRAGQAGTFEPWTVQRVESDVDWALDKVLCSYPAAQTVAAQAAIPVRVTTPNVRMRTRVSFVLTPTGASLIDVEASANTAILDPAAPGSLWVSLEQRLHSSGRKLVPVQDVVGTGGSPVPVPTNTRLWGVSFEIETAGDQLLCLFTPPQSKAGNTDTGEWHVVLAYEAVQRLSEEEWAEFRSKYSLTCPDPKVLA